MHVIIRVRLPLRLLLSQRFLRNTLRPLPNPQTCLPLRQEGFSGERHLGTARTGPSQAPQAVSSSPTPRPARSRGTLGTLGKLTCQPVFRQVKYPSTRG